MLSLKRSDFRRSSFVVHRRKSGNLSAIAVVVVVHNHVVVVVIIIVSTIVVATCDDEVVVVADAELAVRVVIVVAHRRCRRKEVFGKASVLGPVAKWVSVITGVEIHRHYGYPEATQQRTKEVDWKQVKRRGARRSKGETVRRSTSRLCI